jgi:hypothetical protein
MKKTMVFLCLFLFLSASIFAQVSAGFIGGVNINSIRGEDWEAVVGEASDGADSPGLGYGIGAFIAYALNPAMTIRFDGIYQSTASNIIGEGDEYVMSLPVLDLTLSLSYGFSAGPGSLYAIVGPTLRYGLGDFVLAEVGTSNELGYELQNPITYGITGGAGYQLPLGPGYLLLEGRYQFFLSGHWNDDTESFGSKVYMDSILASIGYGYSF